MRTDLLEKKAFILELISNNYSNAEIARQLHCKVDTLKSYYKKLGISYKGNQGGKSVKKSPFKKPALEILDTLCPNSFKRKRLIEDKLKEAKCERCGLSTWLGKPIPLQLHHKDFNHYNNELENLQILCANCHMQIHHCE